MKSANLDWMRQTPIAHRGLHDKSASRYENTLSAVKAAIEHGYSIEVDLHPSKDGIPMVYHDDDLGRLTGRQGPVRDQTAEALSNIKIGGTSDHIPTLRELLDLVAGKSGLIIELKGIAGQDDGFVAAVLNVLEGYQGPLALMSFDHWLLRDARALKATWPLGLTAEGDDSHYETHKNLCDELVIEFVSYGLVDLPNRFVKEFRESGKPIITWTIRSPEQAAKSSKYADQITFEGYLA